MSDPKHYIVRMTKDDRQLIAKHMKHKRKEFEEELRGRILAHLNKLNERDKLKLEHEERAQFKLAQNQKQKEQVAAATSAAQSLTGKSSSSLAAGANFVAGLSGAVATSALDHQAESLKIAESEEKIKAAQTSLYIKQQQAPETAEKVAAILSYRFQFLILRLAGGNNGYIFLANIMADAIESNLIAKLRGQPNWIDAVVDAAIPQTDSLHYKGWFNIRNRSVLKTLDIDPDINELVRRVGPAVRSFLGKPKTKSTYQIVDVLNYPFIINGEGEILSGSTAKSNNNWLMNGENKLPVLLLAPNEDSTQLGLDHGTYVTGQILLQQQVVALLRLVPNFFKDEISHSIDTKPVPSESNPQNTNVDNGSYADLVFPEEQHECPWTSERDLLWNQREQNIEKSISATKKSSKPNIKDNTASHTKKQQSYVIDALQAKNNLDSALIETECSFNELSQPSYNNSQKQHKQDRAAKSAYYVALAAQQLIQCASKLSRTNHLRIRRENYLQEAQEALCIANETLEITREPPLKEFSEIEDIEKQVTAQQKRYELWSKHTELNHKILDEVVSTAEKIQEPNLVKNFVYNQKWRKYDLAQELIKKAEKDDAIAFNLMIQAERMADYSKLDIEGINNIVGSLIEQNEEAATEQNALTNPKSNICAPKKETLPPTSMPPQNANALKTQEESKEDEEGNAASLLSSEITPQRESTDIITSAVIKNLLGTKTNETLENETILKKLLKIESYKNDIERTYHIIFAFLKIDAFKNDIAYCQGVRVALNQKQQSITQNAVSALDTAKMSLIESKELEAKATKVIYLYHRNSATQTIERLEKDIEKARQQIITGLSDLESEYKPEHSDKYNAARIFAYYRNFKFLMNQIYPENSNAILPIALATKLQTLEETAKQYNYQLNRDNAYQASSLYALAATKIKNLGNEPYSLLYAFKYAQITRVAKEKIIHITTGDIAAKTSLTNQLHSLNLMTEKMINDAKTVKQNIRNLAKICISPVNPNSTNINIVVEYTEAVRRLENIIEKLRQNKMNAINVQYIELNTNSTTFKTPEKFEEYIYFKLLNIIIFSADSEDIHTNQFIQDTKSKQKLMMDLVIDKLEEKKQQLEMDKYSLNWGAWAISIAATAVIKYHLASIYTHQEMQHNALPSEQTSSLFVLKMQTKQLILSVYHELSKAQSPCEPDNEAQLSLSSKREIVKDKLNWASDLSHEEQQWVEECQTDASRFAHLKAKQNNMMPYQVIERKKPYPIKLIRHQLLAHSAIAIEKRKIMKNQFMSYLNTLNKRHSAIKIESMTDKNHKKNNIDITSLITTIDELIRGKIARIEELQKGLNAFKSNLLQDSVKLRAYFLDWKSKTPAPLESNARLKAITDATNEKVKAALPPSQATQKEEEEEGEKNKRFDSVTLEDIKELMDKLEYQFNSRPSAQQSSASPRRPSSTAQNTTAIPTPLNQDNRSSSVRSPTARERSISPSSSSQNLSYKAGLNSGAQLLFLPSSPTSKELTQEKTSIPRSNSFTNL